MKTRYLLISLILLFTLSAGNAIAKETFSIGADYIVPVSNEQIDPSLGVGVEYRFWGVFTFSAMMYNEIVYGADNVFDISEVRPIGLFSSGLGMRIPLGGFNLTFGWQKFFTGTASEEGVFPFSDSVAIGASVNISDSFGIGFYTRRLFNFTEQAIADPSLRIDSVEDSVETIGVSFQFHLF